MQKRSRTTFGFRLVSIVLLLSLLAFPILSGTAPLGEKANAAEDDSWQYQNYFHNFLEEVTAVDDLNAWVIGGRAILRTTDGGNTWIPQETAGYYGLCGISACDASTAWAIGRTSTSLGSASVILHTVDGGEEWTAEFIGQGYYLLDICAVDDMNAWAVGDNGTVLTTSDGGATWISRDCGTTGVLNAVCATGAATAWVAGESGIILRTGDNGLSWETSDTGTTNDLNSIHTLDGFILWAVGDSGTVLKSGDGGSSWTARNPETDDDLNDVCAADGQAVWAVGDIGNILIDPDSWYASIYKSLDGGESWSAMGEIYYEGLGVAAPDADNAWVVGGDIDILKTCDGGYTWVDQFPATTSVLSGISVVDANTAFAARGAGDVLKTMDGGTTWVCTDTGPDFWYGGLYDVAAVDAENVWVVGIEENEKGIVLKTTNGGGTWLYVNAWTSAYLTTVAAVDSDIAWVAGETSTILKTSDGGVNWESQDTEPTLDEIVEISAVSADIAWAVGNDNETHSCTILKTVDGGEDWYVQDFNDRELNIICAVDENVVWAAGPYFVMKSTDGGENWETTNGPYFSIYRLFAVDDCVAWAVGYGYDNGLAIFKTCDGGASWRSQLDYGAPTFPWRIGAADCCNAWVVGSSGMIMHTSNGGDDWPDLLSLSPASGGTGAEVAISGCDFGDTRDSSTVLFGDTPAQDYVSWSDDQVIVRVPELDPGEAKVTVATSAGTSNWKTFTVEPLSLQAVIPDQIMQHTISLDLELSGSGFQPGTTVELRRGDLTLSAYNVQVVSGTLITCTCGFFGAEAGAYDVAVTSPGGGETVLAEGFTVTPICGTGSGAAVLMLGLSLGLLSATFSLRRRRRKT